MEKQHNITNASHLATKPYQHVCHLLPLMLALEEARGMALPFIELEPPNFHPQKHHVSSQKNTCALCLHGSMGANLFRLADIVNVCPQNETYKYWCLHEHFFKVETINIRAMHVP